MLSPNEVRSERTPEYSPGAATRDGANESAVSAVCWSAIIAGAVAIGGISVILFSIGASLGLNSPLGAMAADTDAARAITATAIWLIFTQWIASGVGGFLTGRLRTRWVGVHTHEVFFRDTSHGLLAWCLAALLGASIAGSLGIQLSLRLATGEFGGAGEHAASVASLYGGLSLLVGAFIAATAAAVGGRLRDAHH